MAADISSEFSYINGVLIRGPQGRPGDAGSQGPQGIPGSASSVGAQGPQGPQGLQGDAGGPQGVQGAQGAQGDDGPQGNVGSTGPQGSAGPQGVQGVQGSAGPQGSVGPQGQQGAQGSAGPQGNQGVQGQTGSTGAQGSTGSQGNTGAQGDVGPISYLGQLVDLDSSTFSNAPSAGYFKANSSDPTSVTSLKINVNATNPGSLYAQLYGAPSGSTVVIVSDDGTWAATYQLTSASSYSSLYQTFTLDVSFSTIYPLASTSFPSGSFVFEFQRIGNTGPQGALGDTGPTGVQGPQGTQGLTGAQGPQGIRGITNKGAWSSLTSYVAEDYVTLSGSSYVCILANINQTPPNATYWQVLAQQGSQGPQGDTGPTPSGDAYQVLRTGATSGPATMGALATNHIPDLSTTYVPMSSSADPAVGCQATFRRTSGTPLGVQVNTTAPFPVEAYGTNVGDVAIVSVGRGRGTATSPAAAQSGDVVGRMAFKAHTGSGFVDVGWMQGSLSGPQGSANFPTDITFYTADGTQMNAVMTLFNDMTIQVYSTDQVTNLNAEFVGSKSILELVTDEGGTCSAAAVVNMLDAGSSYDGLYLSSAIMTYRGDGGYDRAIDMEARTGFTGLVFRSLVPDTSGHNEGYLYIDTSHDMHLYGLSGADGETGTAPGDPGSDGRHTYVHGGGGGDAGPATNGDPIAGGDGGNAYVRGGAYGAGDAGTSGNPDSDYDGDIGSVYIGDASTANVVVGTVPGSNTYPLGFDTFMKMYDDVYAEQMVVRVADTTNGSTTVQGAVVGGTISRQTASSATIGDTDLTSLATHSLSANAIVSGPWYVLEGFVTTAANGNTKRLVVDLGGVTLLDSGAISSNNEVWSFKVVIMYGESANTFRYFSWLQRGTTLIAPTHGTSASLDLATELTLTISGQNGTASAGDVVVRSSRLSYQY